MPLENCNLPTRQRVPNARGIVIGRCRNAPPIRTESGTPYEGLVPLKNRGLVWSDIVEIGAETEGRASCYFNRGIVASQWLSRLLPDAKPGTALAKIIATPGDKTRNFLAGGVCESSTFGLGYRSARFI
jgi:hypothetical protein